MALQWGGFKMGHASTCKFIVKNFGKVLREITGQDTMRRDGIGDANRQRS